MKARTVLCSLALAAVFLAAPAVQAHEFILKPEKATVAQGQQFGVQAQAAHVFMVSEEAENPADCSLFLLQQGKKHPIALSEDAANKTLAGTTSLPAAGAAWLVGHRAPQVWSETTEGVLAGDRAALEKQGKKVLSVTKYEKFAKTLLNASSKDESFKAVQGQNLEIVLLDNPAAIQAGGTMRCQVLLHGKPVAGALVQASYDGASPKEDTYLASVESDAKGVASLPLNHAGLWMVRTAQTVKAADKGIDQHQMRAVTVFAIQ
ncbi:MAG: DUF4198 domain-containing protein [Desulfovibrionaceae bacterium]|nr:DUF4198 domain-containing protein [Desulfovibrionaceae bacterium]